MLTRLPDRWKGLRLAGIAVAVAAVTAGAASVYIRTQAGVGGAGIGSADLVVLLLLASASVVLVLASRNWRIWMWQSALAVLAWAPLIGPAGDTSCTDCAFILLVPLGLAAIQVLVFVLALLVPDLREAEGPQEDSPNSQAKDEPDVPS